MNVGKTGEDEEGEKEDGKKGDWKGVEELYGCRGWGRQATGKGKKKKR